MDCSCSCVNYTKGADPEDMASIRLWIQPIASISFRAISRVVDEIKQKLAEKKAFDLRSILVELLEGHKPHSHPHRRFRRRADTLEEETLAFLIIPLVVPGFLRYANKQ